VESDAEIARHQLELARTTSDRLWEQYRSFAETLDPVRGVAGPEELRRLGEASDWTWKIYEAEHALFMAENGTPGVVGAHDDYQWLTMLECNIADFLRLCPEVVLDKYLAVTSIDSGTLQLSEQEKKDGWRTSDEARVFRATSWGHREDREDWKVAYSPRVGSVVGLPNETHEECCTGFDEWLVFDGLAPVVEMQTFVNYSGFRLYAPEWKSEVDLLWEQIARLRPESYIADGTIFTFATRHSGLFSKVIEAFSARSRPSFQ
jgi:hypothetical protein